MIKNNHVINILLLSNLEVLAQDSVVEDGNTFYLKLLKTSNAEYLFLASSLAGIGSFVKDVQPEDVETLKLDLKAGLLPDPLYGERRLPPNFNFYIERKSLSKKTLSGYYELFAVCYYVAGDKTKKKKAFSIVRYGYAGAYAKAREFYMKLYPHLPPLPETPPSNEFLLKLMNVQPPVMKERDALLPMNLNFVVRWFPNSDKVMFATLHVVYTDKDNKRVRTPFSLAKHSYKEAYAKAREFYTKIHPDLPPLPETPPSLKALLRRHKAIRRKHLENNLNL